MPKGYATNGTLPQANGNHSKRKHTQRPQQSDPPEAGKKCPRTGYTKPDNHTPPASRSPRAAAAKAPDVLWAFLTHPLRALGKLTPGPAIPDS